MHLQKVWTIFVSHHLGWQSYHPVASWQSRRRPTVEEVRQLCLHFASILTNPHISSSSSSQIQTVCPSGTPTSWPLAGFQPKSIVNSLVDYNKLSSVTVLADGLSSGILGGTLHVCARCGGCCIILDWKNCADVRASWMLDCMTLRCSCFAALRVCCAACATGNK